MEEKKIYKAIPAIMSEIGYIGKDKKNAAQNFMFRGIDQVMNTMKPLLAKHGVFAVPEVVDSHREERTTRNGGITIYTLHTVKYHFVADDGSEVVATVIGEAMDSADKSSNKAMAVAFKYACFQVFCIPTEEMLKADADNYMPDETVNKILADVAKAESTDELNMLFGSLTEDERKRYKSRFTQRKEEIINGTAQH